MYRESSQFQNVLQNQLLDSLYAIFKSVTIGLHLLQENICLLCLLPQVTLKGEMEQWIVLNCTAECCGLGSPDGSSSAAAAGGGLPLSKQYLGSTEIR